MPTNRTEQALARLADLTPRKIVAELDRYIIGQADAKKAVAIAVKNISGRRRWSKLNEWLGTRPVPARAPNP